jgi:hypothetical protein
MNKAKVYDIEERRFSNMLDDIYLYLYNNYKNVAIEEGYRPVPLSEFIRQLWDNIEEQKESNRGAVR